ncbi:TetR/AcrR family transcriptional regulator, partial [Archaeoglobus sp. UBA231]
MTDQTVNILNAALKLYTAKPPHEVSLDDVAREAGVSKSLVLYHFGSKRNLIRATLLHAYRSLVDELRIGSVEELVDLWIKYIRERRKLIEFMLYALSFQSEVYSPKKFDFKYPQTTDGLRQINREEDKVHCK